MYWVVFFHSLIFFYFFNFFVKVSGLNLPTNWLVFPSQNFLVKQIEGHCQLDFYGNQKRARF